ncbi:hypothetical protein B0H67DRAFT_484815 [Lasiosphaeris hirsuta]|uniref:Uncharacterized protein n=1 Tax=Lasiosphaeris hirsuta TaxID=260670 RepID=A0AA40AR23_9PEZI|nr:hypothetical protein B0H67DRAFT_484815 [Lasiosphaeris hirsuta]
MLFTAFVAASGFATLSSAHVLMNTPKPYGVPALHNGPLAPDGSDFPCQSPDGVYNANGASNVMALGSTQPLAFTGTAVHGGGSCQISITYDIAPNKNSIWKVIHSIEGGCPAKNTPGNLGNDPNFPIPFDYSFPLPEDIPAGNGTIAWTWLNKIGNREFYMNCAPVTLTGSGGAKSNWESLPDMLVANIAPGGGCATEEGKDYKYPNPGKSVQSFASGELAFPVGNCGAVVAPPAGGEEPSPGTPTNPGNPGYSANPGIPGNPGNPGNPGTPAPPAPTRSFGGGGIFITVATSEAAAPTGAAPTGPADPAPEPTEPAAVPQPAVPNPPSAQPTGVSPPTTGGGASGGAGGAAGSPCSSEGAWNCIGGNSFQRCASGSWSQIMAVAAGTTCKVGMSSTLEVVASSKQRRVAVKFRG